MVRSPYVIQTIHVLTESMNLDILDLLNMLEEMMAGMRGRKAYPGECLLSQFISMMHVLLNVFGLEMVLNQNEGDLFYFLSCVCIFRCEFANQKYIIKKFITDQVSDIKNVPYSSLENYKGESTQSSTIDSVFFVVVVFLISFFFFF